VNTSELMEAYGPKTFLARLGRRIHLNSVKKGFYDDPVVMDKVAAKLALVHSEVTEVLEALRKSQGDQAVTEEVCDILIRTLDLHDWLVELNLATDNLDETMAHKMTKNENRPAKHGHSWG
jgi:NTP pyrophosphatase (non-canonical NTP hydrolase)